MAVVGALHHGKTLLMDMLVQQTHLKTWDLGEEYRYTGELSQAFFLRKA